MVGPWRLGSPKPFGFLCRQVEHHVSVGDVGNLIRVGEAKTTRCLQDDAIEHVQFRDLQHVLDRTDLLAARGSDRDALAEGLVGDPPRLAFHIVDLSSSVAQCSGYPDCGAHLLQHCCSPVLTRRDLVDLPQLLQHLLATARLPLEADGVVIRRFPDPSHVPMGPASSTPPRTARNHSISASPAHQAGPMTDKKLKPSPFGNAMTDAASPFALRST